MSKFFEKCINIADKNILSGNWTVETAQLFLKNADEQPDQMKLALKRS
jgi:hypothetical protein